MTLTGTASSQSVHSLPRVGNFPAKIKVFTWACKDVGIVPEVDAFPDPAPTHHPDPTGTWTLQTDPDCMIISWTAGRVDQGTNQPDHFIHRDRGFPHMGHVYTRLGLYTSGGSACAVVAPKAIFGHSMRESSRLGKLRWKPASSVYFLALQPALSIKSM